MAAEVKTGHCLCGGCRFELTGPHNWVANCHCESCRRATSSPMTTFIGHPDGHWRWTGAEPKVFSSSKGVERGFCGTCGAPLFYRSEHFRGETHFYAALLAEGTDLSPQEHVHTDEQLPWLHLSDDLPRR